MLWVPPSLRIDGHQSFYGLNWKGVGLSNHLKIVPKLRMSGSMPPFPLHTFMARIRQLYVFTFFFKVPCSLRRIAPRTLGSPLVKQQTAVYMRCQNERAFHILFCLAVYWARVHPCGTPYKTSLFLILHVAISEQPRNFNAI